MNSCAFLIWSGQTPQTNLKSLLIDFYEELKIMKAEEILHAELEKINYWIISLCPPLPVRAITNADWMLMTSYR